MGNMLSLWELPMLAFALSLPSFANAGLIDIPDINIPDSIPDINIPDDLSDVFQDGFDSLATWSSDMYGKLSADDISSWASDTWLQLASVDLSDLENLAADVVAAIPIETLEAMTDDQIAALNGLTDDQLSALDLTSSGHLVSAIGASALVLANAFML